MSVKITVEQKFMEQDFESYFSLVSDIRVMAMITERAIPLDEARNDFQKIIENNNLHPSFGNFKIEDDSGKFIGLAKLEIKAITDTEAELGYMILPEYWGRGIGTHIARILIDRARQVDQLIRLVSIIDPNNIPSRKILINHGFQSEKFQEFDGLPGEILALNL